MTRSSSNRLLADRARRALTIGTQWLSSEPMRALLAEFGGQASAHANDGAGSAEWLPLNEDLPGWMETVLAADTSGHPGLDADVVQALRQAAAVESFAVDHFDFRGQDLPGYRERSQAASADFDDRRRAVVLDCCQGLGLVNPTLPQSNRYDGTLILGGGYVSPQLRAQYAAEIASAGTELGQVYFLGSPRLLIEQPPEAPVIAYYAPAARDEFDLMVAAASREFEELQPAPVEFLCGCSSETAVCPRWLRSHPHGARMTDLPPQYTHERRARLLDSNRTARGSVLSASTGRPPYRPDTSDTFKLWARVANPSDGDKLLIVTTQVFVPFQEFDAYRRLYLEYGADVDVVGFGAERGDRPLTAEYLLQETLSGIRASRRMMVAAAEKLKAEAPQMEFGN